MVRSESAPSYKASGRRTARCKYCRYLDTKQFDAWESIFKKDQNGKFIVRERIRIATGPAVSRLEQLPLASSVTNTIDDNSSWIERMGDYLVGVAVHGY